MYKALALLFPRSWFWDVFWPGLASGAICSLIIGVIVGKIIVRYQHTFEESQARRAFAREVSTTKERLREAVAIPDIFHIDSALRSVPPQAEAATQILQGMPISLWRQEVLGEKPLLDSIDAFQRSYADFRQKALVYDQELQQFARTFNSTKNTVSMHDPRVVQYVLGSLSGFTREKLVQWVPYAEQQGLPSLDEALAAAKIDRVLISAHEQYYAAREALRATMTAMKLTIDS